MEQRDQVVRPSAGVPAPARRRRRPTGAAPPLPKQIGSTGWIWLVLLLGVVVTGCLWLRVDPAPLDRFDAWVTDLVVSFRAGWLDALARQAHTIGSRVGFALLGLLLVLATAWFRRWRHLVIWAISLGIAGALLQGLELVSLRPRPFGVRQLASWEGYATPSIPIGAIAILSIGVAYMLVPSGRPRYWAKLAAAGAITITGVLRIYLGVDHFTDAVFGAIVGVSIPLAAFRAFAPNDLFPIGYGPHGKAAHLDVSGRRGEAIRAALQDQLGLTVHEIKPVGLEGSGGSTPLKMTVTDEEGDERTIFAKLYAKSHVRADRWYKLGRTMLYGRLEDETPFGTVRRFVEYEDYTLRMLGEYGFPTPAPLGIVEITPEREYLIAMDFFDDAVEIGEAEVDADVIDEGLAMIRRMWDVGTRPPRHQARQPDGAARGAEADRRLLRAGAALAVAPGGRPREHDARARAALGRAHGVRAGAAVLHARGARRGVRRDPGRGQPDAAAPADEGRRARPAGRVPRDGADAPADRDAAMERPPGGADRRDARRDAPLGADRRGAVLPLARHGRRRRCAAPGRRCS